MPEASVYKRVDKRDTVTFRGRKFDRKLADALEDKDRKAIADLTREIDRLKLVLKGLFKRRRALQLSYRNRQNWRNPEIRAKWEVVRQKNSSAKVLPDMTREQRLYYVGLRFRRKCSRAYAVEQALLPPDQRAPLPCNRIILPPMTRQQRLAYNKLRRTFDRDTAVAAAMKIQSTERSKRLPSGSVSGGVPPQRAAAAPLDPHPMGREAHLIPERA